MSYSFEQANEDYGNYSESMMDSIQKNKPIGGKFVEIDPDKYTARRSSPKPVKLAFEQWRLPWILTNNKKN